MAKSASTQGFHAAAFGVLLTAAILALSPVRTLAQTTSSPSAAPDPNAAAIAALQTYQLPDQTGSARLPTDWNVVQTGIGYIQAHGPNGEFALFGVTVPAQDSTSTSITATGLAQPYSADPEQKFLQSINWIRVHNGRRQVQAQFYGSTPISAPPAFGSCSNILAVFNGVIAAETDFCSLPKDASGNYDNFFKAVGLPVRVANQKRTLMEAILASYRLNIQAIKQQQAAAPAAAAPGNVSSTVSEENSLIAGKLMMEEANQINEETFAGMAGTDASVNNFDHGVLRGQTPIYAQGMQQPVFWVGN